MKRSIEEIEKKYKTSTLDPWGVDWRGTMALRNSFYSGNIINAINKYIGCANNGLTILDIGCGSGILTEMIAKSIANSYSINKYVAVDVSLNAISKAKKYSRNPLIEYRVINPDLSDLNEKSFDLILGLEMLPYLTTDERLSFLKNIKNLKNGRGFIALSSNISIHENDNQDVYIYEPDLRNDILSELEILEFFDLFIAQYVTYFEQFLLSLSDKYFFLGWTKDLILKNGKIPSVVHNYFSSHSTNIFPSKRNRFYVLQ